MKAVVWRGDRTLEVETIEDAHIEALTDILMRVTSTAICGTDLHIYEGRMGEASSSTLRFLEVFKSSPYADVSLNQWMALTPPELVQAHLNLNQRVMSALRKQKEPVVI